MRFRPHTYASTQQSLRPLGPSKRYLLPSAKNDVSENNFFLLHGRKIHTLKAFHERFSVKFFFAAVFTTLWAVLELRERRWQIVRLKMVLILKLYKIVRDEGADTS